MSRANADLILKEACDRLVLLQRFLSDKPTSLARIVLGNGSEDVIDELHTRSTIPLGDSFHSLVKF